MTLTFRVALAALALVTVAHQRVEHWERGNRSARVTLADAHVRCSWIPLILTLCTRPELLVEFGRRLMVGTRGAHSTTSWRTSPSLAWHLTPPMPTQSTQVQVKVFSMQMAFGELASLKQPTLVRTGHASHRLRQVQTSSS